MLDEHPMLRGLGASELANIIPLCVHEDAGPISKRLSTTCISFASLLAEGAHAGYADVGQQIGLDGGGA
jgi:hypothetical protein